MDIFDDIAADIDAGENHLFLCLVEKYLPQYDFTMISGNGDRISLSQEACLDPDFEAALWEKTKQSEESLCVRDKENSFVYSLYLKKRQGLMICTLPETADMAALQ